MLSDCELSSIRTELAGLLDKVGTIYRKGAEVKDAQGRVSYPNETTQAVRCAVLSIGNSREYLEAGKAASNADSRVRLPIRTTISVKDRIVIDGLTYQVEATDKGRSDALFLTCFTKRLDL